MAWCSARYRLTVAALLNRRVSLLDGLTPVSAPPSIGSRFAGQIIIVVGRAADAITAELAALTVQITGTRTTSADVAVVAPAASRSSPTTIAFVSGEALDRPQRWPEVVEAYGHGEARRQGLPLQPVRPEGFLMPATHHVSLHGHLAPRLTGALGAPEPGPLLIARVKIFSRHPGGGGPGCATADTSRRSTSPLGPQRQQHVLALRERQSEPVKLARVSQT